MSIAKNNLIEVLSNRTDVVAYYSKISHIMNNIIYILILIILTSCSSYTFKSVTGNYQTKGGFEWGSMMDLKEDSNFTYKWRVGLFSGETTGKWLIEGNNLILNSDLQPQLSTLPKYRLIIEANNNADKITFDLLWPDTVEALHGAVGFLFYNGDTIDSQVSDIEGRMVFKKQLLDSIKISFIGFKEIILTNINSDYYKIVTLWDDDEMYEFFTNEIWKIRGDYLIDKSVNDYYYEKRFHKINMSSM